MSNSPVTDPYLHLPLHGVRLIEASAGTGKTFTLATLFTRLVVERQLRIGQILAVTFTEAATQELRRRIRERLALAATLVPDARAGAAATEAQTTLLPDASSAGVGAALAATEPTQTQASDAPSSAINMVLPATAPSDHLSHPPAQTPPQPHAPAAPDAVLTRAILTAHLATGTETPSALRRRLQQAVEEIDLAAIFTIHGFCARVLREHALESGQAFAAPQLLANDRELLGEVAADLWRQRAADAAMADDLVALWPAGPTALASDLRALVQQPELLPAVAAPTPDPQPARQAAAQAVVAALRAHGDTAYDAVAAAFEHKIFDGRRARRPSFDKAFEQLWQGSAEAHWVLDDGGHLDKLLPQRLREFCKDGAHDRVPCSPLFDALAVWQQADAVVRQWEGQRRIRLLHALRDDAVLQLAQRKRQRRVQTYDDLVDGVARALQGPQAEALVQRLRAQYAIALVDEFQDTDDRQWQIFSRVFGPEQAAAGEAFAPDDDADFDNAAGVPPPRLLALIGDPKQAIYGFRGGDVQTYLAAATTAQRAPPLEHNFRSRPGVLAAIDALYAQAGYAEAFLTEGIAFHPVQPGTKRSDADLLRDGAAAPALTLWRAPAPPPPAKGKPKPWSAGRARELCTAACVAAIRGWLAGGRDGSASINGRPVQAGDIAVLVRSHGEATRIQQALGAVGIPAVAAGKQSLFATDEALELLALLQALLDPGDDSRLRAALATVLIGEDAAAIAALEHDGERHRRWQQQALDWHERWQRGGPLALVGDLGATHGQRLLALVDGERRLTNYLQLAELLQEADTRALGPHGLVDWLARRIANADDNDETQQLRLESDARRVQIVTLHKSKGLEYPLVFLPYIGIGRADKSPGRHCVVHAPPHGRQLHWNTSKWSTDDTASWSTAETAWKQEQRAEDARLLYVGLTRAEHALWIATGAFHQHERTALAPMLRDPAALQASAGAGVIALDDTAPPATLPRLPADDAVQVPAARLAQRHVVPDWWVYSFTQLANADAGSDPMASATLASSGGSDEPPASEPVSAPAEAEAFDPRFAGNRFGVAMHDVFERCDFAAWRNWCPGQPAPEGQAAAILEALQRGGYAQDELDDGLAMLTRLVGHTLTVTLPEGTCLAAVPEPQRRNEMEFHFAMRPTRVDALLALLHRFGVVTERQAFGARQRLEGLMTGLIDLTYCADGRWYVLDYKSNRLPAYDPDALARAMAHSEYELQALIYTIALHRWLRFRLGASYDYARDFGGVRYLFCRGLDAARNPAADSSSILGSGSGSDSDSDSVNGASSVSGSDPASDAMSDTPAPNTPVPGIYAWRFDPALVQALDALFAGNPTEPLSSDALKPLSPRERGWGEGTSTTGTPTP
ncbi:exodeoxyribonuclease V subunit beta [Xanthomonas campestris]|uniref:exodeoxyribonuclease V subunit beta n=1 Tax=Xanthomonas TaxID=338 RepID=UPI001E5EACE4|nr:exodeoxyribonuclease V subunit beta [Xanthomonas campestris]MEB1027632.1 exodeoxyribonuclease V subunit beta [Xanthomonas campestris pv. campestris]MCC5045525.1 exodeoxyribonuclease V subunit beta [Xanthomonas campestris]MEB1098548.1 exodeoxyribonuclease V subunit beta [Xanthomonas campestris pv. campestris]MEB1134987.1 exodeoxyribonuclease V subunit beta [Xanthomonas campestris pv. campestris]MEB1653571.1 exodeoxyribonuclease V subunit beta [Xanthomonas campestris pv. campestris]